MRIELVKRPEQSALFSALSPFIALALTLIAGAIMFSLLGKNPRMRFTTTLSTPSARFGRCMSWR